MRAIAAPLAAHLASGATTLCTCVRLVRTDGAVQGFTDHDRDLAFEGTTFEAGSGMEPSEAVSGLGLKVDHVELAGAVRSGRLDPDDLAAGLYDGARAELWRVNWAAPEQRVLLRSGRLGEVRAADGAFVAELRGLTQELDQVRGRLFERLCDAELGDARCRVDLALWRREGGVVEVLDPHRVHTDLADVEPRLFERGRLTWASGTNTGRAGEVKRHQGSLVELWTGSPKPVAAGDRFVVTAGCDKTLATCRERFRNVVNHRGFPHMPGNDFAMSYPGRDGHNDGGRRG